MFSVFITPTRVLGQMSAVQQRVNKKNQVGALHTDSQAAQSTPHLYRMQILATHGTLESTSVWKITVFSTHTLSRQLEQKAVMKKVCACAFHERSHVWDEAQPEGDALAVRRQNPILEERDEVLYMQGAGPDEGLF